MSRHADRRGDVIHAHDAPIRPRDQPVVAGKEQVKTARVPRPRHMTLLEARYRVQRVEIVQADPAPVANRQLPVGAECEDER